MTFSPRFSRATRLYAPFALAALVGSSLSPSGAQTTPAPPTTPTSPATPAPVNPAPPVTPTAPATATPPVTPVPPASATPPVTPTAPVTATPPATPVPPASATPVTPTAGAPTTPPANAPAKPGDTAAKPAAPAAPSLDEDPEVKEGREATEEMLKSGLKIVKDPALVDRVNRIGAKLAAVADVTPMDATYGSAKLVPYKYQFYIVDDPDVNAFCLPGGFIFINKGLLNYIQSDDELACVIGHEITHAAHHHVVRLEKEQSRLNTELLVGMVAALVAHVPAYQAADMMQGFQLLAIEKVNGFSQNAERDADHGGIILAEKAGYNPVGMLTFMERLERAQKMRPFMDMGIFRTHPVESERVANDSKQLASMGVPINRRQVTNMLRVEVKKVPWGKDASGKSVDKVAYDVLLDNSILYRTPSSERAAASGKALDDLLNDDIQLYDVTRRGSDILIRGTTVFSITQDDLALPDSLATTDATAEAGYKQLRNVLFNEFVTNGE